MGPPRNHEAPTHTEPAMGVPARVWCGVSTNYGTEPRPDTPEHAAWMERMEQAHGVADAIIAKQRHGPTGTANLHFEGQYTRFSDLAEEDHLPERYE